jgi:hypothetical protein
MEQQSLTNSTFQISLKNDNAASLHSQSVLLCGGHTFYYELKGGDKDYIGRFALSLRLRTSSAPECLGVLKTILHEVLSP